MDGTHLVCSTRSSMAHREAARGVHTIRDRTCRGIVRLTGSGLKNLESKPFRLQVVSDVSAFGTN